MRIRSPIALILVGLAGCGGGSGDDGAGDAGTTGAAAISITAFSLRGTLDADATVTVPGHGDLDPDPRAYRHDLVLGSGGIAPDPAPGAAPLELTVPIEADAGGAVATRVVAITLQPPD